jgi:GNAT superfamily N-acetyltransferase
MRISLKKANLNEYEEIHAMQIVSFRSLLEKYKDYETSPGTESVEAIAKKIKQDHTDYYFIVLEDRNIGAIRVVRLSDKECRIAPMFILPENQGNGYAKYALRQVECLYPEVEVWNLDTIKQENKLCHLYESVGYEPIGKEESIKESMTIVYYRKVVF